MVIISFKHKRVMFTVWHAPRPVDQIVFGNIPDNKQLGQKMRVHLFGGDFVHTAKRPVEGKKHLRQQDSFNKVFKQFTDLINHVLV